MIFGYPASYADYVGEVLPLEYLTSGVSRPIHSVKDLDGINFLVLFGGEDISTYWYKQNPVKANSSTLPSNREFFEMFLVDECFRQNIPVLGICRGAQWLCCYLGGSLWQHVDGHDGRDHEMYMDDKRYTTNSYHHQMMIPSKEMEVLADVGPPISYTKWGEVEFCGCDESEPEIVYHRSKKVLMIQGHPEWVTEDHDLFKLTKQLIKELLCSN